jgi:hypothetical protein
MHRKDNLSSTHLSLLLMSFQNTLPLSGPMFAGITQHWGRFNEFSSVHVSICFISFVYVFFVYHCVYNCNLYH